MGTEGGSVRILAETRENCGVKRGEGKNNGVKRGKGKNYGIISCREGCDGVNPISDNAELKKRWYLGLWFAFS